MGTSSHNVFCFPLSPLMWQTWAINQKTLTSSKTCRCERVQVFTQKLKLFYVNVCRITTFSMNFSRLFLKKERNKEREYI